MKAATEAVLEQVAQQAAVKAIESAAWGFLDLAMGDFSGAAAAFEAAALFGSVAAAGAISARAIGPSQGGASAPAAGASATSSSASASGYSGAGGSQQSPNTVVNVWGHVIGVSGIQELTAAINDAVLNKDVTLTATNTKNGVQVTR
jgi:predicted alpha/beta hydrolase